MRKTGTIFSCDASALRRLWVLVASGMLWAGAACAQESARQFYQGKQIRFTTMGTPGGGYDAYMRTLGGHLARRLGAKLIPINESGAGGLIAMSRAQIAPPDGLSIALMGGEAVAAAQLFGEPGVNFDVTKQVWLARVSAESKVVLIGPKSPYATLADMIKSERPIIWAGSGKTDGNTDFSALLAAATGMKTRLVIGYKGTGGMLLAMENGEVDGRVVSDESAALVGPSSGMRVMAILARKRSAQFPNAPTIFEAVKLDANSEYMLDWRADLASLGRLLLVTPGTPQDRIDLLRSEFADILADPAVLAEVKKLGLSVSYAPGEAVQGMIAKVMTALDAKGLAEVKDITLNRYY